MYSRNSYIKSKEYGLKQLLSELYREHIKVPYNRISEKELKGLSSLKGGTLADIKADLKILQLVDNGKGICINDKGIRFLNTNDRIELKKSYLVVPLFSEMNKKGIVELKEAKKFLIESLKEAYPKINTLKHNAECAARVYIEFVVGKIIGRQRKVKKEEVFEKQKLLISNINEDNIIDNELDILEIFEIKKKMHALKEEYSKKYNLDKIWKKS